jgi:hypothetical protein
MAKRASMKDLATKWLIEHNHHACHLEELPDVEVPRSEDVTSLAALLDKVREEGRQEVLGEVVEATAKRPR